MTTRPPQDWSPLGYADDPVPGDASDVQRVAELLRTTTTTLQTAQDDLEPIMNGDMIGKRVNNLKVDASTVKNKIGLVHTRYDAAARALTSYGEHLAQHQRRSLELLESARQPARQLQAARDEEWNQWFGLKAMAAGPDRDERIEEYARLQRRRHQLEAEVEAAKAELKRICDERDGHAQAAAGAIQHAMEQSGLNDTLSDKIKAYAQAGFEWVADNADIITTVLDTISTVCAIIGPLTGPLAPVFAVAAIATTVLSVGVTLIANLRQAQRDGNWGKFALTAGITVALSALRVKAAGKGLSKGSSMLASRFAEGSRISRWYGSPQSYASDLDKFSRFGALKKPYRYAQYASSWVNHQTQWNLVQSGKASWRLVMSGAAAVKAGSKLVWEELVWDDFVDSRRKTVTTERCQLPPMGITP